jgi:hypothetical protein
MEITGTGVISDDDLPGYSLLSYRRHGIKFGYATSLTRKNDMIVVGNSHVDIMKAAALGGERPEPINGFKAIYGTVTYKGRAYFCVTSNFDGIGRSGTFQNVRAAYVAPLIGNRKIKSLYYSVNDIRRIKR